MEKQLLKRIANSEKRIVDIYKKLSRLIENPVTPIIPDNAVIKVQKTVITEAQLLAIGNNPVSILTNSDPLKTVFPISFYMYRHEGEVYTLEVPNFLVLGNASVNIAFLTTDILTTSNSAFKTYPSLGTTYLEDTIKGFDNYTLITQDNTDFVGGTGSLDFYTVYAEITL